MTAVGNSVFTPQIWAMESLLALRSNAVMPRLIHTDFRNEVAKLGATVNTRLPQTYTYATKAAAGTYTFGSDSSTNVAVVLDSHIYNAILIEDVDTSVGIEEIRRIHIGPMIAGLCDRIDNRIFTELNKSRYFYGTVSTAAAANTIPYVSKVLTDNKAPMTDRSLVVNTATEAKLLTESNLILQYGTGEAQPAVIRGSLGRKYGLDIYSDQNIPAITSADSSGSVNDTTGAAGDTSLTVTGFGSIPAVGSLMTYAADTTNTYKICDGTTATELQVYPALQVTPVSGNAVVVYSATAAQNNYCFHRNAVSLVSRPLATIPDGIGAQSAVVTDPLTGLSLRVVRSYNSSYGGEQMLVEILFGVKLLDERLAMNWYVS